jgi:hypothetical protein
MAKFFRNRTSDEWRAVLFAFGYHWTNNRGDDQVWVNPKSKIAVLVPSRNESLLLPTSESMARKICIGLKISKKEILKWWKENGYSE